MKIVAAPNAFKGSLTAAEAAAAMAEAIAEVLPEAEVVQVPVADGGDGLVDVAVEALQGERRVLKVTGPRNREVEADYCYVKSMSLVTVEMAKPRDAFVLMRGDFLKPGEKVERNTPEAFPPFPADKPRNRLGLAHWLVSGQHPLTSRVAVNRYWAQF